jgi:hypothetical protein
MRSGRPTISAMHFARRGVIAAGTGVLIAGLAACGSDELQFALAQTDGERVRIDQSAREIVVNVEYGCNDEDAEITGSDVVYEETEIVVTFEGTVSYGDDCSETTRRVIVLTEPLGDRRICDGSSDPPRQLWPLPRREPSARNACSH